MNITLKDVPAQLHRRLKEAAARHGRSINTEAIATLQSAYIGTRVDPAEQLERLKSWRNRHGIRGGIDWRQIKTAIGEGRP